MRRATIRLVGAIVAALVLSAIGLPAMPGGGNPAAHAQADASPTDTFVRLTTDDGLVSNIVRVVHQAPDGSIWAGTLSGLSRYDGSGFVNFVRNPDNPASLPDNVISALTSDADRLYIGTVAGGLAALSFSDHRIEHLVSGEAPLPGPVNPILDLEVDGSTLYVGTSAGLGRYTLDDGIYAPIPEVSPDVNALALGDGNDLWIGSRNGLERLDRATGDVMPYREGDGATELSSNVVTAVTVSSAGTIWVGTETAGVNALDPASGEFRQYRGHPGEDLDYFVLAVVEDSEGTVWTTSGSRMYRLDPESGASTRFANDANDPASIGPGAVLDLVVDRDGLIWIAKQDAGLVRFDPAPKFANLYRLASDVENSANANRIFNLTPIVVDGANSAVVSTRDIPRLWNLETGESRPFVGPDQDCFLHAEATGVRVASSAGASWVWCVTDGQIRLVDLVSGESTMVVEALPEEFGRVWAVAAGAAGELWLGGPGFVIRTDESGEITETLDAEALSPLAGASTMQALPDGRLLAGHWGSGLALIDPVSDSLAHIGADRGDPDQPGLTDPTVFDVAIGPAGEILAATNGGLDVFSPDLGEVRRYNTGTTLVSSAPIRGVVATGASHVWLSHDLGMAWMNLDTFDVIEFTPDDGLQDAAFSPGAIALDANGEVLIGGAAGLNRVPPSPSGFGRSDCQTPPSLSTVRAGDGTRINTSTTTLALGSSADAVELTFQHSCYVRSDLAQLRYRVDSAPTWSELPIGQFNLIFPGLSPGEIEVEVQASDRLGGWISEPARVVLSVSPKWYQRGIVLALLGLALLGLIVGAMMWRTRRIQANNERLERMVEDQTVELRAANDRLNVSLADQQDILDLVVHDLRAPVVRQMMHLGMHADRVVIADSMILRRQVEQMDQLLNRLVRAREVEVGMDLQLESLDLATVVHEAVARAALTLEAKQIVLAVDVPPGTMVWADRLALEEIVDNLLDNAIKYSFVGGDVTVRARHVETPSGPETEPASVELSIADHGVGVVAEELPRLFRKFGRASERPTNNEDSIGLGLFSVKRLVDAQGGTVRAESEGVRRGLTVFIELPSTDSTLRPATL